MSGQLNVETHACALTDVYTFGPTFRAEVGHGFVFTVYVCMYVCMYVCIYVRPLSLCMYACMYVLLKYDS